jgi:DNA-binding IscR family transcriptional regulator
MDKYLGCVLGFDECSDENPCVMHSAWQPVREKLSEIFYKKTLAELDFDNVNKF